jgi:hypothetical protein
VYVQSFPDPSFKSPVSASGGRLPRWRHDSQELYYVDPSRHLVAVTVRPVASGLEFSAPAPLFEIDSAPGALTYDVSNDGRFLVLESAESQDTPITVVVDWAQSLKK